MDGPGKAFKAKESAIQLVEERTTLPRRLRREKIFRFCTKEFPFREIFQESLEVENLEKIHEGIALKNKRMSMNPVLKHIKTNIHSSKRFQDLYERFIRDFIGPLICTPEHPSILYPRGPTPRCHLSSFKDPKPNGKNPHTDWSYGHVPEEINFWLPITKVFGASTLWVESVPRWGDYHPLNMEYGEVCMFWGNQCSHYTLPNDSGNSRISFDFRVIWKRFFNEERARKPAFVIGKYFNEMKIDFGKNDGATL